MLFRSEGETLLRSEGVAAKDVSLQLYLDMRYVGQEFPIQTRIDEAWLRSRDTEALRLQLDFEDGVVTGLVFEVDTLLLRINDLIEVSAVGFRLDTDAGPSERVVSFVRVAAKLTVGGLVLGGEARNFGILGDGSFDAGDNFGVMLSVGSANGDSFKWPSWLPVRINAIGLEWPD